MRETSSGLLVCRALITVHQHDQPVHVLHKKNQNRCRQIASPECYMASKYTKMLLQPVLDQPQIPPGEFKAQTPSWVWRAQREGKGGVMVVPLLIFFERISRRVDAS